ncbi:hypothetical protein V1514DRAFT_326398 [Lipomyces japonicus]|uniref:uncharacterized protein n=1 Tax=Lipomyces japonicus TaxID=56871 RepID=UPI0034CEC319
MSQSSIPQYAIPGQPLGSAREYAAGPGTYVDDLAMTGGAIVASLLGTVQVTTAGGNTSTTNTSTTSTTSITGTNAAAAAATVIDRRQKISVVRPASTADAGSALPSVHDVVLARVLRINPRQANVAILAVGDSNLSDEFGGIIRSQDVTETEKDKVKISNCFRPGDVVRAQVISLGDGTNYYLSTARNDLGVVYATSEVSNAAMFPVDWRTMKCSVSGTTEQRKVAKPN